MFPLSNVHTHTRFSDGANTAEEMVQAAIARGFVSLGFSDHGHADPDDVSMPLDREPEYRAEIRRLKAAYADRIEIALGYEHDSVAENADLSGYDYVIESVHFFRQDGRFINVDASPEVLRRALDEFYGGDPYRMCRAFFREVCRSIENGPGEIVGHIDLVTKFNEKAPLFDPEDPRFTGPALEALRCAVDHGRIVEINTGAMSRGWRSQPYPALPLLKALRAMGGRILISSDCHRADWIDFAFDRAAELARAAGFTTVHLWQNNAFTPTPLQQGRHDACTQSLPRWG